MPEQIRLAPLDSYRFLFAFGPFRLDVRRRTLLCGSARVSITPKELDALHILVAQAGQIVSKDDLAWQLGGTDAPLSDASLTQVTYRLRKTLETHHPGDYIATVPRSGYQFVYPVASAAESDAPETGSDATLYLLQKAKQRLSLRTNAGDLDDAIHMLHQVLEQAPKSAPALAALAEAHLELAADFLRNPRTQYPLVEAAAEKALQIDAFQPGAICALGESAMLFHYDWDRALSLFLQASPSSPRAQWMLSFHHAFRGDSEQAKSRGRRLLASHPSDFRIHAMMGAIYFFSGETGLAELYLQDAMGIAPFEPYFCHMLAQVWWLMGRPADALALLEAPHGAAPMPLLCGPIGYIAGKLGDRERALACIGHLQNPLPDCIVSFRNVAMIHLGLGDNQAALDALDSAYEVADGSLTSIAVHPLFDSLRGHAQFNALVRRLGLPDVRAMS